MFLIAKSLEGLDEPIPIGEPGEDDFGEGDDDGDDDFDDDDL